MHFLVVWSAYGIGNLVKFWSNTEISVPGCGLSSVVDFQSQVPSKVLKDLGYLMCAYRREEVGEGEVEGISL